MKQFFDSVDTPRGAFTPLASDYINAQILAANTAEVVNIPEGARFVIFAATADFYARFSDDAAVPAVDVTDGSASELNPAARRIPNGVTTIGLISTAACTLTMAFYS